MRFALLFLIAFSPCFAQEAINGLIVDIETNRPLSGANVFVSNTTYRAITDEAGQFKLPTPAGKFELVVTFIGYAAVVVGSDSFTDRSKRYTIQLSPETENLREVTILSAKDKARYLKLFTDKLIGQSKNAEKAKILNLDDVEITLSGDHILEVSSVQPLEIENPALNYHLTFLLSHFTFDLKTGISSYSGYQSFADLTTATMRTKKIARDRKKAYDGSLMHFLRSVYAGTTETEGFNVKCFIMKPNPKYPGQDSINAKVARAREERDYSAIMELPRKDLIFFERRLLSSDEFTVSIGDKKYFDVPNYLDITYTKEGEDANYNGTSHLIKAKVQQSQIKTTDNHLEIYSNGNVSNPGHLFLYGYMGWEKLADALPLDYVPEDE